MKRIGVFSGTFDPVHIGHVEVCLVAKAALDLGDVVLLIEQEPERKVLVTSLAHRQAMLQLAIKDHPSLKYLRSSEPNITTKSTLGILEKEFPGAEYWYIVGSDMLSHISQWQEADLLLDKFKLAVILRDNQHQAQTEKLLQELKLKHQNLQYKILPAVWSPVSSSAIKLDLKQKGTSSSLSAEVADYIKKHRLYN